MEREPQLHDCLTSLKGEGPIVGRAERPRKLQSSDGDGGRYYHDLIADFLAVHAFKDGYQGYPAFQGELIAEGEAVRAERRLLIFVSAVLCEWPNESRIRPVSSLWFRVGDEGDGSVSFAVETELVIEALENADLSEWGQIPIPAVEARDPGVSRVLAGDPLYLKLNATRIEPVPGNPEPRLPAAGIRFVVGGTRNDQGDTRAYDFAMAGLTPFLALDAALGQCAGPSSPPLSNPCPQETRAVQARHERPR